MPAKGQDIMQTSTFLAALIGPVMVAGLAIVLYHNLWVADWRVIVTLLGWAGAIGGAARILSPASVQRVGATMLNTPWVTTAGGVAWLAIAAVLCFYGYFA
jgi:hypothetical protein